MADCLGEEAEKTGKGQAGRESGTLRSASEIANMASPFDFGTFLSEWGLPTTAFW